MKIFVYGTLKTGRRLNGVLEGSSFIKRHWLEGWDLYEHNGLPFIIPGEGKVLGEIWEINEETLAEIRMIESGYKIETFELDGETIEFYSGSKYWIPSPVENGIY